MAESIEKNKQFMPGEEKFHQTLRTRHTRGRVGRIFYYFSIFIAILALITLFAKITNDAFGSIAVQNTIDPEELVEGGDLGTLSAEGLTQILVDNGVGLIVPIRDLVSQVSSDQFVYSTVEEIVGNDSLGEEGARTYTELREDPDLQQRIIQENLSTQQLQALVRQQVVEEEILESWPLLDAIFNYDKIEERVAQKYPQAKIIRYHSWLGGEYLSSPMSQTPADAGLRTAILGSISLMVIVVAFALPVGVGAAIYLEEYAGHGLFSRIVETNVRNLAGVPSIIYGLLGLTILVRILAPITSGMLFGYNVESPKNAIVTTRIADALDIEVTTDELTSEFVEIASDTNVVTNEQFEELITIFQDTGTYSLSNDGELPVEEAAPRLAEFFDLELIETVIDSELFLVPREGTSTLSDEQFIALSSALSATGSFTVNGRTILSAGLTLALLILPIIIINGQEALRAVPNTIREASYGLGATKWQTIWRQILPVALPGILTGTILAVSRAVGETAPLIVVGASTFITFDPTSPFSKFTAIPIQINNWAKEPDPQFKNVAAAAIIVLLVLMLALNAIAIFLRNRYSKRF